jgi:hypothetical protein
MKSEAPPPPPDIMDSLNFPHDPRVNVALVARRMLSPLAQKLYMRERGVFSPEDWFTSKLFAAVQEAFSNAYPHKDVQNKTTVLKSPVS